tara:strand:+ start:690 stop:908 length:219 start_codon:yes stop_codon:yes gene_type:complete
MKDMDLNKKELEGVLEILKYSTRVDVYKSKVLSSALQKLEAQLKLEELVDHALAVRKQDRDIEIVTWSEDNA